MGHRRLPLLALAPVIALAVAIAAAQARPLWHAGWLSVMGARTVQDVIDHYGTAASERLRPRFEAAGVAYPPEEIALLAFKQERVLELWARASGADWGRIHIYPVLAASGVAGPKLREGDRQVPEGQYRIISLNPNSAYHLSMKLNYPNEFDGAQARAEGRHQPGSDIFIHGRDLSIGCLAMGDPAIEELFVLVETIGRGRARVLIAPHDPRRSPLRPVPEGLPVWTNALYADLETALRPFIQPDITAAE